MDACDFLSTAKDLLSRGAREADYRSCISRAYYCVYHVACAAVRTGVAPDLCRRAGIRAKKDIGHKPLITYLKNASDPEVQEAGDELGNLQTVRVRADYHLWRSFDQRQAQEAIDDADEQRQTIEGLTAARIGRAITPYLESIYPART